MTGIYVIVLNQMAEKHRDALRAYREGKIQYKDLPGACVDPGVAGLIRRCRL